MYHKIYSHKKSEREIFKNRAKEIKLLADIDRLSSGNLSEALNDVIPLSPKLSSFGEVQTLRHAMLDQNDARTEGLVKTSDTYNSTADYR